MMNTIAQIENNLQGQLSELNTKIKLMEADLTTLREGFLKVQGALEILDVLKKELVLQDCNVSTTGAN